MEINTKIPLIKFNCDTCHFYASKKRDYERHLATAKHIRLIEANSGSSFEPNDNPFVCSCGKEYKHMSSLCKHKKECLQENKNTLAEETETELLQLIKELVKVQTDLLEICKNCTCNNNLKK